MHGGAAGLDISSPSPAAGLDTCFYQLRRNEEHHVRVSVITPLWGSFILSQFTRQNSATFLQKEL